MLIIHGVCLLLQEHVLPYQNHWLQDMRMHAKPDLSENQAATQPMLAAVVQAVYRWPQAPPGKPSQPDGLPTTLLLTMPINSNPPMISSCVF